MRHYVIDYYVINVRGRQTFIIALQIIFSFESPCYCMQLLEEFEKLIIDHSSPPLDLMIYKLFLVFSVYPTWVYCTRKHVESMVYCLIIYCVIIVYSTDDFITTCTTKIRPLLEYACPIWGGIPDYLSLELQRVQDRCLKFLGLRKMSLKH